MPQSIEITQFIFGQPLRWVGPGYVRELTVWSAGARSNASMGLIIRALLVLGGIVAEWFIATDSPNFSVMRGIMATFVSWPSSASLRCGRGGGAETGWRARVSTSLIGQ